MAPLTGMPIRLAPVTAKLNEVDPRAWLADVLARINDHHTSRLHELIAWNWRKPPVDAAIAA